MAQNLIPLDAPKTGLIKQLSLSSINFQPPQPANANRVGLSVGTCCCLSPIKKNSQGSLFNLSRTSLFRGDKIARENLGNIPKITSMGVNDQVAPVRYAVVTGANKGIGLETVRQIAASGVTVILTARNEKRGMEATSWLHEAGLSNIIFHQLDVQDKESIKSLARFIEKEFGRLDILVNNAGASGVVVEEDGLRALNIDPASWLAGKAVNVVADVIKTTYEKAKECLETNYYGVKNVTEALLPLLQLSTSGARIVNVSSLRSELSRIPNEQRRKELGHIDTLTEEKIDGILQQFLHDLKHDALESKGWQKMLPAYSISKATLNAYARILAKKCPQMCINCVRPGFVNTDLNWHTGTMTVEEGAAGPVMLALLPEGGSTGCYFDRTQVAKF